MEAKPDDQVPSLEVPGYTEHHEQLLRRLARIEGQVRGVMRMIDERRYCIDVLQQISAVQAALDKVALGLVDDHVRGCVMDAEPGVRDERTEELLRAVARLVTRR
jgi:CsoR family transcriptional regulator, copper-sensing transcriptional repressor